MPGSNAFTRSLSRLSRRKKKRPQLTAIEEQPNEPEPMPISTNRSLDTASDAFEVEQRKRGIFVRGMDRLRRSIRHSLRRKKSPERTAAELVQQSSSSQPKSEMWQPDEGAVRAGACSFQVKYLGAVEVFESRGMQVCEGALKLLRSQKRRPVKAMLHVSGDGLRVVDQENNRGLLVDQTIEKVSFCAPDRNNDRGFAYICRDGATRRWMCHGFQASKESGERLSHAVGCAFAVCLEKKKKRDEETAQTVKGIAEKALNPDWDDHKSPPNGTPSHSNGPTPSTSTNGFQKGVNPAYNSFRKVPISERLQDPQAAIVTSTANQQEKPGPLPNIAKPRPAANPQLFQRQGSLRAPEPSASFRRQFSLRPLNGVSFDSSILKTGAGVSLFNEPIYEGDEDQNRPLDSIRHTFISPQEANFLWNQKSSTPTTAKTTNNYGLPVVQESNGFPQTPTPQNWIHPESTGSSQNELISINQEANSWTDMNGPPKKKADDWLENALRNINISPTAQIQQAPETNGHNGYSHDPSTMIGFTNYGSSCAPPPGNINTAQTSAPPPIPARPAISKDAVRILPSQPPQPVQRVFGQNPSNFDQFGQQRWESPETVQWERPPQKVQISANDDPFDVQWSQVAVGQQVNT